jgi:hypothetical protein
MSTVSNDLCLLSHTLSAGSQESEALSRWFSAPICVRHGSAHIIPATRTHVAAIRSFLQQFLEPSEPP